MFVTMNDHDAIEHLIDHHGSVAKAAKAMGISETRVANWRRRGISNEGRPLVYTALRRLKVRLPVEWAFAHEHDYSNIGANNGGTGNGKAHKARKTPKRRAYRAQPKIRRGAGRGLRPMDEEDRRGAERR